MVEVYLLEHSWTVLLTRRRTRYQRGFDSLKMEDYELLNTVIELYASSSLPNLWLSSFTYKHTSQPVSPCSLCSTGHVMPSHPALLILPLAAPGLRNPKEENDRRRSEHTSMGGISILCNP